MTSSSTGNSTRCPVCGSAELRDLGRVYHSIFEVAGAPVDIANTEFHLIGCSSCGFQLKSPPLSEQTLLDCYARATSGHWGEEVNPRERNYDIVAAAIGRHAKGRRILDIGCFTGTFLDYLGSSWERFGVEPATAAAALAERRGAKILGRTLDDVPVDQKFDVIVAMDVIEHIVDPTPFFRKVGRLLKPGGIFVASTGDTGSWTFRLQGARYWYITYLPEHFSFYCRRTMEKLAQLNGMESIEHQRMSHKRTSAWVKISQGVRGVLFALLMPFGWLRIPSLRRRFATRAGTIWIAAADHMVHVMKRI
jgi:2-polyprenyl-3-methyl-5-hydroxy-6-metoxy-1,4-benzoquinol methylase